MSYVNPDPMPVPGNGQNHLFAASPDNDGSCSWCGQPQYPDHE